MKYLLLVLVFISTNCFGQKRDSTWIHTSSTDSFLLNATTGQSAYMLINSIQRKQDTIPVLMLVCDTSEWVTTGVAWRDSTILNNYRAKWYNKSTWWQFGYLIYEGRWVRIFEEDLWSGATYLDQNKKPLSKNIIIWMTKEIQ